MESVNLHLSCQDRRANLNQLKGALNFEKRRRELCEKSINLVKKTFLSIQFVL